MSAIAELQTTRADAATVAEPAQGVADAGGHKRRVNALIHDTMFEEGRSEPAGFFCECASARCFKTVWLSPAAYEARRAPVLVPGH